MISWAFFLLNLDAAFGEDGFLSKKYYRRKAKVRICESKMLTAFKVHQFNVQNYEAGIDVKEAVENGILWNLHFD